MVIWGVLWVFLAQVETYSERTVNVQPLVCRDCSSNTFIIFHGMSRPPACLPTRPQMADHLFWKIIFVTWSTIKLPCHTVRDLNRNFTKPRAVSMQIPPMWKQQPNYSPWSNVNGPLKSLSKSNGVGYTLYLSCSWVFTFVQQLFHFMHQSLFDIQASILHRILHW